MLRNATKIPEIISNTPISIHKGAQLEDFKCYAHQIHDTVRNDYFTYLDEKKKVCYAKAKMFFYIPINTSYFELVYAEKQNLAGKHPICEMDCVKPGDSIILDITQIKSIVLPRYYWADENKKYMDLHPADVYFVDM